MRRPLRDGVEALKDGTALRLAGADDPALAALEVQFADVRGGDPPGMPCGAGTHRACRRAAAWSRAARRAGAPGEAHLLRLAGPQRRHAPGGRTAQGRAARRHAGVAPLRQAPSGEELSPAARAGRAGTGGGRAPCRSRASSAGAQRAALRPALAADARHASGAGPGSLDSPRGPPAPPTAAAPTSPPGRRRPRGWP